MRWVDMKWETYGDEINLRRSQLYKSINCAVFTTINSSMGFFRFALVARRILAQDLYSVFFLMAFDF